MPFNFRILGALWVLILVGCVRYSPKPISLAETGVAFESRSLTNAELQARVQSGLSGPAAPIERWNLDALTLAAFYYHPSLRLAQAQAQTASAAKITADTSPNPTVGFTPGYNFDAVSPTSPWFPGTTIDFPIETAGKRGKRLAQAHFLAEAARLNVLAARWQTRSNLRGAVIEISAAKARESLIGRQITNQTALIAMLEERFEAGAASKTEIAPFQINLLKMRGDQAAARSAFIQAQAHVAEAIGVPVKAVAEIDIEEAPPKTFGDFTDDPTKDLRKTALQHRADLLSLLARYEAAQAALQLEIAKQYPDLRVGSGYQWDQGESKWNLSVNFEIPILNRNRGPIAEAEARRTEIAAQVLDAQGKIINEMDRTLASVRSAQEELRSARDAFGVFEQQARLARDRFAAGGADRVEIQTAVSEQIAAALLEHDARIRAEVAAAALEAVFQAPTTLLPPATINSPPAK